MAQSNTMQPTQTFRGTWDQVLAHSNEIPKTSEVELRVFDTKPQQMPETARNTGRPRVSAMGKYAGILSSEEFMRRKQEEIDREDRLRR